MNKVILIGHLTRDVKLITLQSGFVIGTVGIAMNRRFKKSDGSLGDEATFIELKLLGRAAEIAHDFTGKGAQVCVEGRLTQESWTDQQGTKRNKILVTVEKFQLLDKKSNESDDACEEQDEYVPF